MVTMGPLWLTVMELLMALVEVGAEAAILLCIKLVNEDHLPLVLALYSTVFINVVNVQLIFWRYYYYRRWFIVHLACTLVGLAIDVLELIAIGNIFVTPGIDYIPLPSTVFILLIHMMDVALHEAELEQRLHEEHRAPEAVARSIQNLDTQVERNMTTIGQQYGGNAAELEQRLQEEHRAQEAVVRSLQNLDTQVERNMTTISQQLAAISDAGRDAIRSINVILELMYERIIGKQREIRSLEKIIGTLKDENRAMKGGAIMDSEVLFCYFVNLPLDSLLKEAFEGFGNR